MESQEEARCLTCGGAVMRGILSGNRIHVLVSSEDRHKVDEPAPLPSPASTPAPHPLAMVIEEHAKLMAAVPDGQRETDWYVADAHYAMEILKWAQGRLEFDKVIMRRSVRA